MELRPATCVSAPGKLILMGEHAVVFGRPAIVAAIDLRTTARIDSGEGSGVRLHLPQVRCFEELEGEAVVAYARAARERWQRFDAGEFDDFSQVVGDDPAHLVKVALGEAAESCTGGRPGGIALRLDSQIPLGAGFGSSAATAAVVVAATLLHRGQPFDPPMLEGIVREVERRQHGRPSGVDHNTVLRGGLLWAVRREGEPLALEPFSSDSGLLEQVHVFHTGAPAESTGEVVAGVRALRDRDPEAFDEVLDRLEFATRLLRRQLLAERHDVEATLQAVRTYQRGLERLGVVPEAVREAVRAVERAGGAAKLSGAGSLAGPGAGCLLVFHPDAAAVGAVEALDPYLRYPVRLAAAGLREEELATESDAP